ncbi:MAG: MarR family transcriptional regulator [Actinomycetota bacterium]
MAKTNTPEQPDRVDSIIEQWNREEPELDVSAMAIIGRIGRLERLLRPRLNDVFAHHGLESWEFDVLATLLRSGTPYQLTPGALLESTMVTSGAMTNRIDRLADRGLVERRKNPADKRQVLVALTAKGRRTVGAAVVDHAANESTLLAALDRTQQAQLISLLRTLHRSLDEPDPG